MLATILSRAQYGMQAPQVSVEVYLGSGLPAFHIVGLPEAVVKESRERVRAAIVNAHFQFPTAGRITVNLAPADLPKEGGRFDLPIALGVLVASGQLPVQSVRDCEFFGELSLGGELRPVRGMLPAICQAALCGHRVILPSSNLDEATLIESAESASASHLLEVCAHLKGDKTLCFGAGHAPVKPVIAYPDLADVRGQAQAKRALEIAAAGGHSVLLVGPPGTGKSMLANRLPGLLPPMTANEALEAASVASIALQGFRIEQWGRRPFRAPHHTSSAVALVGGGSHPRPGEISLAHQGVLFLDELPEFDRHVLESLREPLEAGTITLSRAARQAEFPARFQLVAAMNPCPCGYLGDPSGKCRCTPAQIRHYRGRVSGPLLDRIDLCVEVPALDARQLGDRQDTSGSDEILQKVVRARAMQLRRCELPNARLAPCDIDNFCPLHPTARLLLERSAVRLKLSARAYQRIRKVARTIADLEGSEVIAPRHIGEAVQFRRFEI